MPKGVHGNHPRGAAHYNWAGGATAIGKRRADDPYYAERAERDYAARRAARHRDPWDD